MFFAHSTKRPDKSDWEPMADHHEAVGTLCEMFAAPFGAGRAAGLAGRLHDLGKYAPAFQAYIAGRGGSIDHSTAGARAVMALDGAAISDRMMRELLAYAIAGHHAGLPDRGGAEGSLAYRLNEDDYHLHPLDDAWRADIQADGTGLFPSGLKAGGGSRGFQFSVLGRMLFSCLVDADFLATEQFYARTKGLAPDRDWPRLQDRIRELVAAFDAHMEVKRARREHADIRQAALDGLRREVLDHVRGKASLPKGVFTLDVPTGGGKTLASLAFALDHAQVHGHDRIIFAIPFTSIVEQTADVFTQVLGPGLVLEHHSALGSEPPGDGANQPADAQRLDAKRRLAMENWAAPLVVTTSVQFFESLFAHKTSRCRKLHNIANSIIILDEAQVLPLALLRPCVAMLDELARNYGCTVVLCTATQPALLAPGFKGGFAAETTRELAPDPVRMDAAFRRVILEVRSDTLADGDLLAELAAQTEPPQGLVIVNGRRHALALYTEGKAMGLDGLIHLTTRQTAADRRIILADVRARLAAGAPCRVIATSLIEAGVDVSFPRAWRAMAGLDSIIQAAGRVNREWHWRKEGSRLIVFTPLESKPPHEIARFAQAMATVAGTHTDLFSKAAIEAYFSEVYWQRDVGGGLDRIRVPDADGRKVEAAVLDLFTADNRGRTDFAYRKVGEAFRFIEERMEPVIIPFAPEAQAALDTLNRGASAGAVARKLQGHVVQVPQRDRDALIRNGHVTFEAGFGEDFPVLRTPSLYSRDIGLRWEQADELGRDYIV